MSSLGVAEQGGERIGLKDSVVYARRNDRGEVVMQVPGTVIGMNYRTQQVQIAVNSRLRFWVPVASVSVAMHAALTA